MTLKNGSRVLGKNNGNIWGKATYRKESGNIFSTRMSELLLFLLAERKIISQCAICRVQINVLFSSVYTGRRTCKKIDFNLLDCAQSVFFPV